jgi:hypothetical protein
MAWRRSAARAARLDGGLDEGAFGDGGASALPGAALSARRRLAGFKAVFSLGVVREPGMVKI